MTALRPQIRCLLLDLDGTLVDTAPDLAAATNRVLSRHGHPGIDNDSLRKHVTSGARGMVRAAAGALPDAEIEALALDMVDDYANHIADLSMLYSGMDMVLEHAESLNIPWGIVTNKFERLARALLKALGLAERCAVVVGGDSCASRKPSPEPITQALIQLNQAAETTVYVGDAQTDLEAARAAGCIPVFAQWGYGPCAPDAADKLADVQVETGHALCEWLLSQSNRPNNLV